MTIWAYDNNIKRTKAMKEFIALDELNRKTLGARYSLGFNAPKETYFGSFNSWKKGHGAEALRRLCALADKHGVAIELGASDRSLYYVRTGKRRGKIRRDADARLIHYYNDFGFRVINGAYAKKYCGTCDMRREPA